MREKILFFVLCFLMRTAYGDQVSKTNEVTVVFFEPRDSLLEKPKKISTWKGEGFYYYITKKKFYKIKEIKISSEIVFSLLTESPIKVSGNEKMKFKEGEFDGVIICHENSDSYLFFGSLFWKRSDSLGEYYKSTELSLAIGELRRK